MEEDHGGLVTLQEKLVQAPASALQGIKRCSTLDTEDCNMQVGFCLDAQKARRNEKRLIN